MIVFDEQLQGHELRAAIKKWYPGTVTDITIIDRARAWASFTGWGSGRATRN